MNRVVEFHPLVRDEDLPALDRPARARILKAIREKLAIDPEAYGERLRAELHGYWKLRVGEYRVIYEVRSPGGNGNPCYTWNMRIIGRRREAPLSFSASGELLAEGARFNDELRGLPTGDAAFIPKGLYRFRNHEEAAAHAQKCLVESMARIAARRA